MDQSPFGLQTCHANRCNQARLTESAVNLATVLGIFDPMRQDTAVTKPRLDRNQSACLQSEKRRRQSAPAAPGPTDRDAGTSLHGGLVAVARPPNPISYVSHKGKTRKGWAVPGVRPALCVCVRLDRCTGERIGEEKRTLSFGFAGLDK